MGKRNTLLGGAGAAQLLHGVEILYMVGIGGVGMSSLAYLAREAGFEVLGEDAADSATVRSLCAAGISVTGQYGGLPSGRVAVVYSAAIAETHPVFLSGAPMLSRSDLLAYFMRPAAQRITVAGIHGKSTVTAMLDHIFTKAGRSPTTVSGATLGNGETYRIGSGDAFIAEACEYTDSFLSLDPTVAIALNLEHDHPDYFPTLADLERSFGAYLARASRAVIIPSRSALLASLSGKRVPVLRFGGEELDCDEVRVTEDGYTFRLLDVGVPSVRVTLPLIGRHMIENALAALLAARACGISYADGAAALADFKAPRRRLERRRCEGGVTWYDDYAHHPSEIRASLSALREHTRGRLLCVFQSHTYTRTRAFLNEFADALALADRVLVLPIYAARERDELGVSAELLAERIGERATAAPSFGAAAAELSSLANSGDTVVVMGAGDVDKIFEYLS